MDIDKMEAGLKTDELVHTEIMEGELVDGYWFPEYSTDISAAWQVVEKMSETWEFSLNYQDNKYKFLLWKPEWITSNLYQARECKEGVSNTVPLAICRAALKAVEMVDVFGLGNG